MQKASTKYRSPRHLANRVPNRTTIPSRRLQLTRFCDRRACQKKREERRWSASVGNRAETLVQGYVIDSAIHLQAEKGDMGDPH